MERLPSSGFVPELEQASAAEKETRRKPKDVPRAQAKIDYKVVRAVSRNGHRDGLGKNGRDVKVSVRLLPETRLPVALANEEVEARRRAGQSEAKIWKDCQRAPLTFVKRGYKRLLSA